MFDQTPDRLPRTIGYLITRFDEYGGAQIHVRDIALAAQAQGHRVIVITGAAGAAAQAAREAGLDIVEAPELLREIKPATDIRAVFTIARMIHTYGIELLHCHSSKAGIIGRLAAKKAGIPAIFTAHGWAFTDGVSPKKRKLYRAIEKMMAPLASRIITVSEYDREIAIAAGVGRADRMVAIQNGMPVLPALDRPVRGADAPLRLIMVARIDAQKNQAQLLRALGEVKSGNWRLSLVGAGADDALRQIAQDHGIADKVDFLGQRSDVPELLASHDVFCLITNWEGFPLTIVEAMRAGMPVIASDVGGCKEAIEEGVTGTVVPRNGETQIARAIEALIADPELVAAQGAAGRAAFEARFTFEHMAEKTFATYDAALGPVR